MFSHSFRMPSLFGCLKSGAESPRSEGRWYSAAIALFGWVALAGCTTDDLIGAFDTTKTAPTELPTAEESGSSDPADGLPEGELPPHSPQAAETGKVAALSQDEEIPALGADNTGLRQEVGPPSIALLVPVTGQFGDAGRALLDGAQMAMFDVGNADLMLKPYDTQGSVSGAEAAVARAISDGADIILGPLLAGNVAAVRPMAEQAGLKLIAFSNDRRVAGGPVFIAGLTPEEQVNAILRHAVGEGRTRFAVLAPANSYGQTVVSTMRDTVSELGAALTHSAFYNPDATDFADQIKRISNYDSRHQALIAQRRSLKQAGDAASRQALAKLESLDTFGDPPFDAIVVPSLDEQTLRIIAAQLSYYDVDQPVVRILGLQRWDGFGNLGNEPSLLGAVYPALRNEYRGQFEARFARRFGYAPDQLTGLSYDMTAVAAALSADDFRVASLTHPQGYIGAEGLFRFNRAGWVEHRFAIMEITESGPVVAVPAGVHFPQAAGS